MKLIRNDKTIKRNKIIGNILSVTGIAVLAVGLILNLNPTPTNTKTLISFGSLVIGFIITQVSTYFVTRFGRSPRYDEVIAGNLERLNDDYTFYVYSSPIPLLLVGPYGLWIPTPTTASGEIYYDRKWKQRGGGAIMKLLGQENIGRPDLDVQANEKEIFKFFSEHFDEKEIPPVRNILVSLHPKATIGDVENAPIPIAPVDALRRTIRRVDRKSEQDLPLDVISRINSLLEE